MATPLVRTRIDPAAVAALVHAPEGAVYRHMVTLAARIETRAKQNLSGRMANVRTGNLRSSVHTIVETNGLRITATIAADAPYALPLHEGTQPHDIVPRRARVLAWRPAGGTFRFATRVHHPGTKPRPFLRDALEEVRSV